MLSDKYFTSNAKNKIVGEAQRQIVFLDTSDNPLQDKNLKRRLIASGMTEGVARTTFGMSNDEFGVLEKLNHSAVSKIQDTIIKYYTNAITDSDTVELEINPILSLSQALNLPEAYILFVLKGKM